VTQSAQSCLTKPKIPQSRHTHTHHNRMEWEEFWISYKSFKTTNVHYNNNYPKSKKSISVNASFLHRHVHIAIYTLAVLTYLSHRNIIRFSSRNLPRSVPLQVRNFIDCGENHESVFRITLLAMIPFLLVSYLFEHYLHRRNNTQNTTTSSKP